MDRVLPQPTPETQEFWDGCREGELRLQRCTDCSKPYFPPRPFCPVCGSRKVETFKASGKGKLWSYVINHRPRPDESTSAGPGVADAGGAESGPSLISLLPTVGSPVVGRLVTDRGPR